MKNKFLIVGLILALFIPTYIGIYSYIDTKRTPVTPDSASGLIISDIAGKTYEETIDSDIAALLSRINANAIRLQTPPETLSGAKYFKMTYIEGKRETEYRYFFALNTSAVYYLDPDGVSYLVSEEDAAAFLETKYAQSLYAEAYLPQLVNGENQIAPLEYVWAYESVGGKPVGGTLTDCAEGKVTYTSKNGLLLSFSREPATFRVTIKNPDGTVLYSGDYDAFAGDIDVRANPVLTIEAEAEWLGNEEHMSSGKATYSFILNIEEQTAFYLGADTVLPGGFVAVTATNVSDPSAIGFKSEPVLSHGGKEIRPVFYADGKTCHALLPTTYETEAGTYTLTFTYSGVSYTAELKVEEKTFKTQSYDISKTTAEATRTEATLSSFAKLVTEVAAGDFSKKYFDGLFGMGIAEVGYNGTIMTGYGLKRNITALGESYRHDGVDYYAKNGSEVLAVNAGRVIYVGASEYAGVLVAVDHGWGLISWYANLSEATVKVGDVVQKDDVIAKSGSTGFTKGNSLHVGLSVFDVPVCTYDLWETPLQIY